ncbi:hypothetical protein EPI10_006617 [Gossypium australe]|uniref:Uncharacterized protein n=1 Tax=Gossypium australe TaxID=47621 RepID=A0A5B6WRK4_9ROSI|nr:hypothetical protein EPI10_006617 [Gossypium australe]
MERMIKIQLGKWKVCVIVVEDKGKKIETNFVCENDKDDYGIVGITHLEVVDFFTTLKGIFDLLIYYYSLKE